MQYTLAEIQTYGYPATSRNFDFKAMLSLSLINRDGIGFKFMFVILQGVNKHNGETVAVKTFNQLSHMRPQEVQMREFEVLQKVKHENIVKLLAIEEEQEGRGKVIVMELCTGIWIMN